MQITKVHLFRRGGCVVYDEEDKPVFMEAQDDTITDILSWIEQNPDKVTKEANPLLTQQIRKRYDGTFIIDKGLGPHTYGVPVDPENLDYQDCLELEQTNPELVEADPLPDNSELRDGILHFFTLDEQYERGFLTREAWLDQVVRTPREKLLASYDLVVNQLSREKRLITDENDFAELDAKLAAWDAYAAALCDLPESAQIGFEWPLTPL